jgi:hypothetical protein
VDIREWMALIVPEFHFQSSNHYCSTWTPGTYYLPYVGHIVGYVSLGTRVEIILRPVNRWHHTL